MLTLTRHIGLDYGHRLQQHAGGCRNYHGHRGEVEVTFSGLVDPHSGMIVDFGEVKTIVGGWINEHWDHAMIVQEGDPIIPFLYEQKSKLFILEKPPTAENLANYLARMVIPMLPPPRGLELTKLVFRETPNCFATWERSRL